MKCGTKEACYSFLSLISK